MTGRSLTIEPLFGARPGSPLGGHRDLRRTHICTVAEGMRLERKGDVHSLAEKAVENKLKLNKIRAF